MPDIYLLRHGQVATDKPWRFVGQADLPLTDEGRNQMREWRLALAEKPPAGVVCSDLGQARESARMILGRNSGLEAVIDPGFREINLGAWEGLNVAEVEEKFPGAYQRRGQDMGGFVPEGGESFSALQARALAALNRAVDRFSGCEGPIVLVTHLGVCRVLIAHFLRIPLPAIFYLEQRFARAHLLRVSDRRFSVAGLNMPAKAMGLAD